MPNNQHRPRNLLLRNRQLNSRINRRQRNSWCGDSRPRLSDRAQPGLLTSGTPHAESEAKPQPHRKSRLGLRRKDALTLHNPHSMTQETQVRGCHLCHIMNHQMTAPHENFDHQDQVFAQAFTILQQGIDQQVFPAASLAVMHEGNLIALKALGSFTYNEKPGAPPFSRTSREGGGVDLQSATPRSGDSPVHPSTLFDLASLTKVVATTPTAMLLYERGLLDLEAPATAIVPEFTQDAAKDPRRHEVTLRMLLAHCSGLPAHEKFFLKARNRNELLQAAFTTPLAVDPATRAVYSDIGFIILGVALERLADESLDRFSQREIFAPLGMTNTTFNPPAELRAKIPPTANDQTFRQRVIQGEVYDENASVLGGVAPQAGLFSIAADLAKFAQAMLNRGSPILRPETVSLFTRREPAPAGTTRALGWDTPSTPSLSGKYFSPQSYGHLGYTGTSLWIDPTRQLSITLLTNRTWPDCSNQAINQLRPKFHNAIIEALNPN
jgi:serine-type D-Ala-D-Ala carboxypeptidase